MAVGQFDEQRWVDPLRCTTPDAIGVDPIPILSDNGPTQMPHSARDNGPSVDVGSIIDEDQGKQTRLPQMWQDTPLCCR
jgi:hypothetical protein